MNTDHTPTPMNHCRKCDSDYATPGSCNCFAPATTATESADYWRGHADGQRAARGQTWWPYQWPQYWYSSPTVITPCAQPTVTARPLVHGDVTFSTLSAGTSIGGDGAFGMAGGHTQ